MTELVLIGGGGHCRSVIDTLLSLEGFHINGIVDPNGEELEGIPVLGNDDILPQLYNKGIKNAVISVGSVESAKLRGKLYNMAKSIGFSFPNIMDRTAIVSKNASIGEGVFIGKGAIINSGSQIGNMTIINTGSIIEHDCAIGTLSHIAPGAVLCGTASAGEQTLIGANTIVIQGVSVGNQTIIGAGSVVVKNIPSHKYAYGNPCRIIEEIG